MKKFRLTLITENQNSLEKGKKFAELICRKLNSESEFEISKYEKFRNSYRIEIIGRIIEQNNSVFEAIEMTDRICSPWLTKFNRKESQVELMFNKNEHSDFRENSFNVLRWGNFEIIL